MLHNAISFYPSSFHQSLAQVAKMSASCVIVAPLDPNEIDVTGHLKSLSHASGVLTREEIRAENRCCEVGQEVLRHRADRVVREAGGRPLLQVCSCDGTPTRCAVRVKLPTHGPGSRLQVISGHAGQEFLTEHSFIRDVNTAIG